MKQTLRLLLTAAALVVPGAAHAGDTTINFDDVQPGTIINSVYSPLGVTFQVENASPFSQDIQAIDDTAFSAPNSLDATVGVVDVLFDPSVYSSGITLFQITSLTDLAGYSGTDSSFLFYGADDTLLYSITGVDQSVTQTVTQNNMTGVVKVVLPADAYYDNLSFTAPAAVPEAGTSVTFGVLLALGGVALLRRRRTAA